MHACCDTKCFITRRSAYITSGTVLLWLIMLAMPLQVILKVRTGTCMVGAASSGEKLDV